MADASGRTGPVASRGSEKHSPKARVVWQSMLGKVSGRTSTKASALRQGSARGARIFVLWSVFMCRGGLAGRLLEEGLVKIPTVLCWRKLSLTAREVVTERTHRLRSENYEKTSLQKSRQV